MLAGLQPPLDLTTKLFGQEVGLPFFTCPTAGNKMFHHEGEMAVARAAAKHSSLYCLSSLSTTTIEDISTVLSPQHPKLFQIYVWKDRDLLKDVLSTAKRGDFQSMALTVDLAWYGNRERDIRNGFSIPPDYSAKQIYEGTEVASINY